MKKRLIPLFLLSTIFTAHGADKPNVLFIAIDDMRPDIGAYGNDEVITPSIDELASEGMVFHNAYCQMALCGPSRNSIMTGMYPDTIGIWGMSSKNHIEWRDGREHVTSLTEQFRKHGYQAVGWGKIYDFRNGFDEEYSWDEFTGVQRRQLNQFRKPPPRSDRPAFEALDAPDEIFPDAVAADDAISYLESFDTDAQPLFMAVGFVKPHLAFIAPKKYWDLYDVDTLTLASKVTPPDGSSEYLISPYKEIFSYNVPDPVPDEMAADLIHGYYACVSFIDAQIGKLVEALKEKGIYDETLIVIWGDHGFKLGDHGEWAKDTNFELDARIPLIIKPPEGISGVNDTQALAELVDVMPTMLEIAGLPIPETVQGVSLVPVLNDPSAKVRDFALTQDKGIEQTMGYSIRTPQYRYNEWRNKRTSEIVAQELYHLKDNRLEMKNIIDEKPEIARLHAQAVDDYIQNTPKYQQPN
ncbi:MAG: sulfatase [Verrucomicrobiota bacterium]